jgi:hypothetical protein
MLSLLLALALPASAASHEINFEAGWLNSSDTAWNRFSTSDMYGTYGLRVGVAFHPRIAAIAGWQHGVSGVTIYTGDFESEEYYEEGEEGGVISTGFYGDQFTLGLKGDVELAKWLHPYATVQAVGLRAIARLDDDQSDDENPGQVQRSGFTGGGLVSLGVDFPIGLGKANTIAIAPYTELGYGLLAPLKLAELGSVQMRGFTGRVGVGLRF